VHRVRLGPKVRKITVSRSAGVQVGDHNRQLNQHRFYMVQPRVSLDRLLKGHPSRLRSFERLVANPHSWIANYAFRQHLSARPARPGSRVLFAGTSRARTVRISARVDEYGATVVENSPAVQVGDHNIQRNDFDYKLANQEVSLEGMLHGRPDLALALAMMVRHPGNPAVQRSFTRQISKIYTHGSAPSLRVLNRDWPGGDLSVQRGAGVQAGDHNFRTDRVSVDMHRLVVTGWDSAERIAAKIGEPGPVRPAIDEPGPVPSPAQPLVARQAPDISRQAPFSRGIHSPGDHGPSIRPF
jgi:hypothetical protein